MSNNSKITVGMIVNDLRKAGAERLVTDLAIQMKRSTDIKPHILVANTSKNNLMENLKDENIGVHSCGLSITHSSILPYAFKIKKIVEKFGIDILHSHLPFSTIASRFASLGHIPHITTYHSTRGNRSRSKKLADSLTHHFSDVEVFVSEGVRESYSRKNSRVVYNAINPDTVHERVRNVDESSIPCNNHHNETVFINIGRCVDVKNQTLLIDAISEMNDSNSHLYILGDGPNKELLEQRIIDDNLGDLVTMVGFVEDISPYLHMADVFVSSSKVEGLPTAHLEAMAAGLPIVSTDVPGSKEVVEHGHNGYLFSADDHTELVAYMQKFLDNPRQEMGMKGHKLVQSEFSIESVANQYVGIYHKILN